MPIWASTRYLLILCTIRGRSCTNRFLTVFPFAVTVTVKIFLSFITVVGTEVGHATIVKLRYIPHHVEWETRVSGIVDREDLFPLLLSLCSQEACQESNKSK